MPKKKPKLKTLAIDPGTREMGVAILENDELAYYGVKTLKKKRPTDVLIRSIRQIIYRLCDDYQPSVLAIEETFSTPERNLSLLHVAADEVVSAGLRRGLLVKIYSPRVVRQIVCENARATKREVAKIMADRYPELKTYIACDRFWKEKYWQNMFDAVALGLASFIKPRETVRPSSRPSVDGPARRAW